MELIETEVKEIMDSIVDKAILIKQLEGKEYSDLVEIQAGVLYKYLTASLILEVMNHKEKLYQAFDIAEVEANDESNSYELRKRLKTILGLKKVVEFYDLEKLVEETVPAK